MKVVELWRYPIKSCAGVAVAEALAQPEGFAGDRRLLWVLQNGRFVTQREYPQLALVKTQLSDDQVKISIDKLSWTVALNDFTGTKTVKIWNDEVEAQAHIGEINQQISDRLGITISLVKLPEKARPISDLSTQGHVSFADALPYLITNMCSLDDLNQRLQQPVTMLHFRANIVVDGCSPYAEDGWQQLAIGEAIFRVVKPCARCVMTTINPKTAVKRPDAEPLKTLASYRQTESGQIIFGQNLIVEREGVVRVGDQVTLL